jgi:adenylosuccinate synthase
MPLDIVVGAQWGDEGKGRVVDLLSRGADITARFNGGDNAGHTVTIGERIYKLHLIPSGFIHPRTQGVLGNGMVINPLTLLDEMDMLRQAGVDVNPQRLSIADAAALITPAHRLLDAAQEAALKGGQIGTTGRGIGPAYVDKVSRRGLRVGEMLDLAAFKDRLAEHLASVDKILRIQFQHPGLDQAELSRQMLEKAVLLQPYIRRVGPLVRQALADNRMVLAEAAQGTLLDLEQGTYPFVTSSCTTAAGVFSGLGIGITPVRRVVGVTKTFQTRVGAGPFPTELTGAEAVALRGTGSNPWDEYGTTTGRPRRVGWLDLPLLRYAVEINGITELFLTKLDVLSGFTEIPVCTAYRVNGRETPELPTSADARALSAVEPVYTSRPGWDADLRPLREYQHFPAAARAYVEFIEKACGVPVRWISVGPERNAVVEKAGK